MIGVFVTFIVGGLWEDDLYISVHLPVVVDICTFSSRTKYRNVQELRQDNSTPSWPPRGRIN